MPLRAAELPPDGRCTSGGLVVLLQWLQTGRELLKNKNKNKKMVRFAGSSYPLINVTASLGRCVFVPLGIAHGVGIVQGAVPECDLLLAPGS